MWRIDVVTVSATVRWPGRTLCKESPIFAAEIGRRAFVARAVALGALWQTRSLRGRSAPTLRVGVVTPAGDSAAPALLGARLGAEEASHSAALFGAGTVELMAGSIEELLGANVVAMLSIDAAADRCLHVAGVAAERGVLCVNTNCGDDSLRGDKCRASAFHVAPSNAMLTDALAEARRQSRTPLPDDVVATAWDSSLERFGADTLNNRFRARFNKPMTAAAWCAWFAVKALGEASLRARSVEARPIATYLRGATAQFDGHKGRALSFRAWDNQLRQPVYVMAPSNGRRRLIAEAPGAATGSETSRDQLDHLGTPATSTRCRFAP